MTFPQRIRNLSVEELAQLSGCVKKETTRRETFIRSLKPIRLADLPLRIQTRDLLYRTIGTRGLANNARSLGEMAISQLFETLKKGDWMQMQQINPRAFQELRDLLVQNNAPLEQYYGVFKEKVSSKPKLNTRKPTTNVSIANP